MRKLSTICSLLFSISAAAQSTNVTATIQDSSGQTWFGGTYSITFVPTPGKPGPFYWQGAVFVPQVYTGSMNGSGVLSVTLPDNFTITPSGSQWAFVLCANTSATCTTITVPVTGASEDFSSTFSSRVVPPKLYSSAMPRAYSSAEIYIPPPNQGGQFFSVTTNLPYFWNGSMWIALSGTVSSVGLTMPSLFNCTGSPITTSGTIVCALANQNANTVFAGPSSGSAAPPTFRALTLSDLPSGIVPTLYYQTMASSGTGEPQRSTLNFSSSFTLTDASPYTDVALTPVGTAGTCASPTSITTNTSGQITACTPSTAIPLTCTGVSGQAGYECYKIDADGLITEFGFVNTGAGNPTTGSITFPHAFTVIPIVELMQSSVCSSSNPINPFNFSITTPTTTTGTSFNVVQGTYNGSNSAAAISSCLVGWTALGS